MKYKIVVFLCVFLFEFMWAKEYKINLVLDENSFFLFDSIKADTKTLFDIDDNINYKLQRCSDSCEKIKVKGVYLLNKDIKEKEQKESYFITFNHISNAIDKKRVSRAVALAIFEYLKENNKTASKYIKNSIKEIILKEKRINTIFDLDDIYKKVVSNNFEFRKNNNETILSSLDINEAKTLYKPQLEVFSNVIQIDSDRAKYSNGQYSEGTVEIGAKLSQVVFSNKVLENIKIKKLLDKSNISNIKSKNDEIIYKTIVTYLNVLKAQKYKEIIKIKQNFITQNLNFAKQRFEVGVKDKTDVYRWESELANVNIQLANAVKDLNSLKIELANISLIQKEYKLKDYDFEAKRFKLLNTYAKKVVENEKVQKLFLEEIILTHPNLIQINKLIEAKEQEKSMNEKSRYLPNIALEAQGKKIVERYGEAKDYARYWDDKEYQAVLNFSFPFYEGGKKSVQIQKNQIELINLKLEYENAKNLIRKNIKQNSDSLNKSYEKIFYAKDSQNYSKKNYQSILDRYKVGKENIITLLDAQNSYFISKINKTISEIDYLEDLSSIYFFSGNIQVLVNSEEKRSLEEKLLKVINEN
ncbi:hypothetical protein CP965_12885 [Halarcobacter mediterraneus]|uniref:Transporter n=1 Tax=Halarcobacter mediterraneus TaxID=2023153 RepID=A0A4Q1ASR6_9BACT|nr:TolC family protein [Halarcobacter mediterraneus]RXK11661.1 hypothetical protein CP965_12885 [Halarcobacter mediterraneus]